MAELAELKRFMRTNKITQEKAASLINVTRETLNAKLNGRQAFKTTEVDILSKEFNADISIFFNH